MASAIKIKYRGTNWSIDNPIIYPYDVEVSTAIENVKLAAGNGYGSYDHGSAHDYRVCKTTWRMSATLANTFYQIVNDNAMGRGITLEMNLGKNSGFYPGGPDKGDSGTFKIRLTKIVPRGVMEEPWIYFDYDVEFVIVDFPTTGAPAQVTEGDLEIGTVQGLRWPNDWSRVNTAYGIDTQLTRNGTPYSIDHNINADSYEATLPMICNYSKAWFLINHLVVTVRATNVTVTTKGDSYLFDRDNGGAGSYTCRWINNVIKIKHVEYDQFHIPLTFYRVS